MLPLHFGVADDVEVDIQVQWTDVDTCEFTNINVEGGPLFLISEDECLR